MSGYFRLRGWFCPVARLADIVNRTNDRFAPSGGRSRECPNCNGTSTAIGDHCRTRPTTISQTPIVATLTVIAARNKAIEARLHPLEVVEAIARQLTEGNDVA